MINNDNRVKRQHQYFQYSFRPIVPALCSDNQFHQDMYERSAKGLLTSFGNESLPTFRSVHISEIVTESGTLDEGVAFFNAEELRQMGLPLPLGFEKKYKDSLIPSYILNSSLCYVETTNRNGKTSFFATKNLGVIHALTNDLAETEKRKKVDQFIEQLSTSHFELTSGIFEALKLVNDNGGLKLQKCRINSRKEGTVIIPMYIIGNYIDRVIRFLGSHRVVMTYLVEGEEYPLVTSLREDILAKWINTNNAYQVKKIQDSWQNPFVFNELILPDLTRSNEFVTVQVLDIISIRNLE
ncbi:hypothetical protein [Schinkia azotoformans]|uniref:hypothetical protein n=1 Tax=Schinkia azotoformans TaxID=1454 RepID=UPI002DB9F185|nr:hypothetical protein [Schinkia azotoformans]MEC1718736.1 hypothetical protein [Schinkia azotoformans]MEC1742763.1 hypothetical protein [Schinkia azotoformans]MEC1748115.1 hypothetical protein [Schinkia azotoformans]MEC1760550.1 hypothetical protein [Schinkia azotoformans]MEC1769291.1 hypothetical protein [Schinkia azotoformans]